MTADYQVNRGTIEEGYRVRRRDTRIRRRGLEWAL